MRWLRCEQHSKRDPLAPFWIRYLAGQRQLNRTPNRNQTELHCSPIGQNKEHSLTAKGPLLRPDFLDGEKDLMAEATAIVELARGTEIPLSRAFLRAYHWCEAEIAAASPHLPENAIRVGAVLRAIQIVGRGRQLRGHADIDLDVRRFDPI